MDSNTVKNVQALGRAIGYPITVDGDYGPVSQGMVGSFQRAFNPYRSRTDPSKVFGAGVAHLQVDHVPGDHTIAAMKLSADAGGRLSLNFVYNEFACGHKACGYCGGWLEVPNAVLTSCELAREYIFQPHGMGFTVIGGSRCYSRNRYVIKGASNSQHLHVNLGNAADPESYYTWESYRDRGTGFTAYEVRAGHGDACFHGDCRPGNPRSPQVFGWAPSILDQSQIDGAKYTIEDIPQMYAAMPGVTEHRDDKGILWTPERAC